MILFGHTVVLHMMCSTPLPPPLSRQHIAQRFLKVSIASLFFALRFGEDSEDETVDVLGPSHGSDLSPNTRHLSFTRGVNRSSFSLGFGENIFLLLPLLSSSFSFFFFAGPLCGFLLLVGFHSVCLEWRLASLSLQSLFIEVAFFQINERWRERSEKERSS
jgi:hypothetical protein